MASGLFILVFFVSALLSWWLTSQVRDYALKKNLMDIPNARSSHSAPTPRGGGVSIIIVFLLFIGVSLFYPETSADLLLSLMAVVLAFALLGWQDDKLDLPASLRFLIQLLIAGFFTIAMFWQGMVEYSSLMTAMAMFLVTVFWIVWMANLYNFMDGIDGISAVETIVAGLVTSIWFAMAGSNSVAIVCLAVAGAALGFLRWNWSPARIFMGDVGSLSLGAFFAVIALIGIHFSIPFTAFLILYAVYLADAGVTLLSRIIKKERWWQAHRSHFYQRAVQSGFSHAQVSLSVLIINIFLAALASLVVSGNLKAGIGLFASLMILAPLMFLINSRFNRNCRK